MADIIPLTNDPSATFNISLNNVNYNFQTKYNYRFGYWTFDMYQEERPVALGIAMVLSASLLKPYPEKVDIGTMLMVDTGETRIDATLEDLGTRILMQYASPSEVEQIVSEAEALGILSPPSFLEESMNV
jgi:hypothetical protein